MSIELPKPPDSASAAASANGVETPVSMTVASASSTTPKPPSGGSGFWVRTALVVLAGLAFIVSVAGWQSAERTGKNAARKLQEAETRSAALASQLQGTSDNLRELQGRIAVMESRLSETAGQQAQLERLYRSISQAGIEGLLSDVEHAISIASQQLLVGGNVPGALVLLQDVEARLKGADAASLGGLRRLLLRDIERLKALPSTDMVSVLLRLDNVLQSVDALPLLASFGPAAGTPEKSAKILEPVNPKAAAQPALSWLGESSLRTLASLRAELQSLVRVNRIDSPEAVLLAPEQSYFVRENLRLLLLNARAALLARQDSIFRGDIERSQKWLNAYFDNKQIVVGNAATQLRQLQSSRVSVEMPSLAESLNAVRSLRTGRTP